MAELWPKTPKVAKKSPKVAKMAKNGPIELRFCMQVGILYGCTGDPGIAR